MAFKKTMKNKRGVMGLDSAKSFILVLMVLGIIGFASLITFSNLSGTSVASDFAGTVTNETGGFLNVSGYTLGKAGVAGFNTPAITQARNTSSGAVIGAGNYSVSSTGVVTNSTSTVYTSVEFDYTYKYNGFDSIESNISNGTTSFFSNAGTWFALIAVVVIILIVTVVIFAVNRFGGSRNSGL